MKLVKVKVVHDLERMILRKVIEMVKITAKHFAEKN